MTTAAGMEIMQPSDTAVALTKTKRRRKSLLEQLTAELDGLYWNKPLKPRQELPQPLPPPPQPPPANDEPFIAAPTPVSEVKVEAPEPQLPTAAEAGAAPATKKGSKRREHLGLDGAYWATTGLMEKRRSTIIAAAAVSKARMKNKSARPVPTQRRPLHFKPAATPAEPPLNAATVAAAPKTVDVAAAAAAAAATPSKGTGLGLDGVYWQLDEGEQHRRRRAPVDMYTVAMTAAEKRTRKRRPHKPHAEFSVLRRLQMRVRRMQRPRVDPAERAMQQREAKTRMHKELLERVQRESRGVEVVPGLFLGSQRSASHLEWLREANIRYIVNCTTEVRNSFSTLGASRSQEDATDGPGAEPQLTGEAALLPVHGCAEFEYKRVEVHDSEAHERRYASLLEDAIAHIDSRLQRGDGGVLVHCKEGKSRAPTLVICFLMSRTRWPLAKAFAHVSALRGGLRLNPAFEHLVESFEKKLFGVSSMNFLGNRRSSTPEAASSAAAVTTINDTSQWVKQEPQTASPQLQTEPSLSITPLPSETSNPPSASVSNLETK